MLLVIVFHTSKVHDAVVVWIFAPVQREGHEILLRVGPQIRLHLVPALLFLGNGRVHILIRVGALVSGEFLTASKNALFFLLVWRCCSAIWPC